MCVADSIDAQSLEPDPLLCVWQTYRHADLREEVRTPVWCAMQLFPPPPPPGTAMSLSPRPRDAAAASGGVCLGLD